MLGKLLFCCMLIDQRGGPFGSGQKHGRMALRQWAGQEIQGINAMVQSVYRSNPILH